VTTPHHNDELLPLSFALHSAPGAYALLLGAGVSRPSGIPTAWDMLKELTAQVALLSGETPSDSIAWYEHTHGVPVRYETLLEKLALTQQERQQLLHGFFEPEVDVDSTIGPTTAHRAIARLVSDGVIRVIVTLDFDRLMEQALQEVGIHPVVITTAEAAAGIAPLHTLGCCVIHLHGDYKNPRSMLNTVDELSGYSTGMAELLNKVLSEYGLIAAGWSAEWDAALRQTIASRYPARYTLTWIEPGDPSAEARDLCALKGGQFVRRSGDEAFGFLADAITSLRARNARHPLSVSTAATTAKRELSGRWVATGLHDTWGREMAALHDMPELHLDGSEDVLALGGQDALAAKVDEALRVPAALVASMSYWGDETVQDWWLRELPLLAQPSGGGGGVALIRLPLRAAAALYWAGGVAAAAAGRFDLLRRLLELRTTRPHHDGDVRLAEELDRFGEAPKHEHLAPVLQVALETGARHLEESWQVFEVSRLALLASRAVGFASRAQALRDAQAIQRRADLVFSEAEKKGDDVHDARVARADAYRNEDRAQGSLADLVPPHRAHLFVDRPDENHRRAVPVVKRLQRELVREGDRHRLVRTVIGDADQLSAALTGVAAAAGRRADQLTVDNGPVWLDAASERKPAP